ncbi:MAG TPA: TlpA disulfide reductase family protein [Kofleriaceae bacterium]|nr:TlpA disulfide reductase family protein [Kofleriaceae bacterium]
MKGAAGVIAAVVALLAGVLVLVFVQFQDGGDRRGVRLGMRKAEAACTEEAPRCLPKLTMIDTAGRAWPPEAMADKVVIVNVWATWCKPCATEIPDLMAIQRRYADRGVILIGLLSDSVDDAGLEAFARRYSINYPIVRMDDELYEAFDRPDMLPTTFLYDRSGHLRFGEPGIMTEARLAGMLDDLLAE